MRYRVKSKETAAYKLANMSDEAAKTLGDEDPIMKIDPGVLVDTVGPAAANAHGVMYMPVQLVGQDDRGVYWIRSSSLEPTVAPSIMTAPAMVNAARPNNRSITATFAPAPSSSMEPWKIVLAVVGAVAGAGVLYGVYRAVKK